MHFYLFVIHIPGNSSLFKPSVTQSISKTTYDLKSPVFECLLYDDLKMALYLSTIGPQIPNYHSVTGLFVHYSNHYSVNRPFSYLTHSPFEYHFGYRTHIHHLNTGCVRLPNAYCICYSDTLYRFRIASI